MKWIMGIAEIALYIIFPPLILVALWIAAAQVHKENEAKKRR